MGTELDPPPIEIGETIQSPRFTSVRRGCDPKAVDDFVMRIATSVQALETELRMAGVATEAAHQGRNAGPADGSGRLSKRLAGLITAGERDAKAMIAEAKAEAATNVSEAASDVERIRGAAQDEADRSVEDALSFLEQAKEEAGRTSADLADLRQQTIEELQQAQERLLNVAQEMELELQHELSHAGSVSDVPEGSA